MYTEDIIPAIIDQYESFTKGEQVIADFFVSNKEKQDFSIRAMKERLYVSEASLSRFAKKLGFRGYREFIYQYQQTFVNVNDRISISSQTVLSRYNDLLRRSFDIARDGQIKKICRMIGEARRVLVVGIGSSGLAAEEMKRRFVRLGVWMESCDQRDMIKMAAIFQGQDNMVIGISLSGLKEEVLFALEQSHQRGARTVFITGNAARYSFVDELVMVAALKNLDNGNLISPQFPILVMIDLLYGCFLEENQNKRMLHQETVEMLQKT